MKLVRNNWGTILSSQCIQPKFTEDRNPSEAEIVGHLSELKVCKSTPPISCIAML
jgi:hypothetical protein